jgi:hypothetical protein
MNDGTDRDMTRLPAAALGAFPGAGRRSGGGPRKAGFRGPGTGGPWQALRHSHRRRTHSPASSEQACAEREEGTWVQEGGCVRGTAARKAPRTGPALMTRPQAAGRLAPGAAVACLTARRTGYRSYPPPAL